MSRTPRDLDRYTTATKAAQFLRWAADRLGKSDEPDELVKVEVKLRAFRPSPKQIAKWRKMRGE